MNKKIGIIGAMDVEINILIDLMKTQDNFEKKESGGLTFYTGLISGVDVVVVKSGVGKVNAALCALRLILEYNVSSIINTGIAGAIARGLGIFDMVVSTDAVYHDMDAVAFGYNPTEIPQMKVSAFPADEDMIKKAKAAFASLKNERNNKMIEGRIATGDQFISSRDVKNNIIDVCDPACVEMEGAAIAHTCFLNNVPYVILRCMSDMAEEDHEKVYVFNETEAAKQSAAVVIELLKNI